MNMLRVDHIYWLVKERLRIHALFRVKCFPAGQNNPDNMHFPLYPRILLS